MDTLRVPNTHPMPFSQFRVWKGRIWTLRSDCARWLLYLWCQDGFRSPHMAFHSTRLPLCVTTQREVKLTSMMCQISNHINFTLSPDLWQVWCTTCRIDYANDSWLIKTSVPHVTSQDGEGLTEGELQFHMKCDTAALYGGLPGSHSPFLSLSLMSPIGRLYFGALNNKLVCFSFIIHIDMNYKNENRNCEITVRYLSFPFIKGWLTWSQRTGKMGTPEIILRGLNGMFKLWQCLELVISSSLQAAIMSHHRLDDL